MKVIIKKLGKKSDNDDLSQMFNQMVGGEDAEWDIVYPKYLKIKSECDKILIVLNLIVSTVLKNTPESNNFYKHIAKWAPYLESLKFEENERTKFTESYQSLKDSEMINVIFKICDNLSFYKTAIYANNTKFLNLHSGNWLPIPVIEWDFKQLFISDKSSNESKLFILLSFQKLHTISLEIYKMVTQPDIDIDKFCEVLVGKLGDISSIPQLSRCDRAFKKLRDSVGLLKENFGTYYRDFTQAGQPTIILENYILDVSKGVEGDLQLAMQFKKIVRYYQETMQKNKSDPQIQNLLSKINKKFDEYDRATTNLTAEKPQ